MKMNKILAIVLVIILLSGVFFSFHFIVAHSHHDCTGKGCPICAEIEQAVLFITNFKFVPILSFLAIILCAFAQYHTFEATQCFRNDTLISLKVEMLN